MPPNGDQRTDTRRRPGATPPSLAGQPGRRFAAPAGAPRETSAAARYEAEVAPGLEPLARDELRALAGRPTPVALDPPGRRGIVGFAYAGDPARLLECRTILAIASVRRYATPRPRGLLGDQHFRALLAQIAAVRALGPNDGYATLYVSAAGSESAVLLRLKEALAEATGLAVVLPDANEGDLQLRLRRPPDGGDGWESLVRLSPRPLGTRPWRVCNLRGSLNATVAHAMALLTRPDPRDVVLNLACGSGTLLIERAACAPATALLGVDLATEALDCARANVAAAGLEGAIALRQGDARALDLPDASIDALLADLPFGHLVGSHDENLALYPALLAEAARVARRDAPLVLLSHEVRLMDSLLRESADWATDEIVPIALGGLHPRIFVLRRR